MASAPLIGGNGEEESREKLRWGENKFYTRKFYKSKKLKVPAGQPAGATQTVAPPTEEIAPSPVQHQERQISSFESVAASGDDGSSLNDITRQPNGPSTSNGDAAAPLDNSGRRSGSPGRVVISVSSKSRREIRELRIKLEGELEQVRALAGRLQIPTASAILAPPVAYNESQPSGSDAVEEVCAPLSRLQLPAASTVPAAPAAHSQSHLSASDAVEEVPVPESHPEFPTASTIPAAPAAYSHSQLSAGNVLEEARATPSRLLIPVASTSPDAPAVYSHSQLSASNTLEEFCASPSHLQIPVASNIPTAPAAYSHSQLSPSHALEEARTSPSHLQIPAASKSPAAPAAYSHSQLSAREALEEPPTPAGRVRIPIASTIPTAPATYSHPQLSASEAFEEARTPSGRVRIPIASTIPAAPATYSHSQLSASDALEEPPTPSGRVRIPIVSSIPAAPAAYSHSQLSTSDALEEPPTPAGRVRIPIASTIPATPATYSHSQLSASNVRQSAGTKRPATNPIRRHLSVSVPPIAVEFFEKEKRTPKANQFYTNSEFLLAKDKIPSSDSHKKSKTGSHKKHKFPKEEALSQSFKNCAAILSKLMKHKYGWVFNSPVDARALGLHDYHLIIKHPMDLGTIKTRLEKGRYKSLREFADDVRLTFKNAMTYNPRGQDVHTMAQELSDIFEERWPSIESGPLPEIRVLERSASYKPVAMKKPKPKAKDPDKRDMTFEEKQKLSTNLQNLPSEKLESIVQIIKKRMALSQNDDEIEVDIDSVDNETLWELDRFVTNYKKSLSKNRRRAELARLARAMSQQQLPVKEAKNSVTAVQAAARPVVTEVKEAGNGMNVDEESSSSSSSSDSGTSSSDSDSDSSSGYGSDGGRSS